MHRGEAVAAKDGILPYMVLLMVLSLLTLPYQYVLPSMQLDAVHSLHDLLKEGVSSDEIGL